MNEHRGARSTTSVIIAAHDEEATIGRCLDALLKEARPDEFDVIVVANGCSDATAQAASSRRDVRVLELGEAGKAMALNAGERIATGQTRVYLDADIVVSTASVRILRDAVDYGDQSGGLPIHATPMVAVPARLMDLRSRPLPVRAYYAINSRLPAMRDGIFGRGFIVLSEKGRERFERFPELVADDLFLDSLFTGDEVYHAINVSCLVSAPYRTGDLVNRLVRVRRGNSQLRQAIKAGRLDVTVREPQRWDWLTSVVLRRPWLAPAAVVYLSITVLASGRARRSINNQNSWERDESSRRAVPGQS